MKLLLFIFLVSLNAKAQSSYGSANQDTEQNAKAPTHLDTGYSNKDVEEQKMEFSGDVGDSSVHPGVPLEKDPNVKEDRQKEEPKKKD